MPPRSGLLLSIRVLIPPYGVFPRGYGAAYRPENQDVTVCYPVPLNWVVGWARSAWIRLKHGPSR